jgi:hypothetical protein
VHLVSHRRLVEFRWSKQGFLAPAWSDTFLPAFRERGSPNPCSRRLGGAKTPDFARLEPRGMSMTSPVVGPEPEKLPGIVGGNLYLTCKVN